MSAFLSKPSRESSSENFLMWQGDCLFNRYHESHEAARGGEKAWIPANDVARSGRRCANDGTIRSRISRRNSTYALELSAMTWMFYEKELNLTATLDGRSAYKEADFVVIDVYKRQSFSCKERTKRI